MSNSITVKVNIGNAKHVFVFNNVVLSDNNEFEINLGTPIDNTDDAKEDYDDMPGLVEFGESTDSILEYLVSNFGYQSRYRDSISFRAKIVSDYRYSNILASNPVLVNNYIEIIELLDLWFVITRCYWDTDNRRSDLQKLLDIDGVFCELKLKMPIELTDDQFQFLVEELAKPYPTLFENDTHKSNRIILTHILTAIRDPSNIILDNIVRLFDI